MILTSFLQPLHCVNQCPNRKFIRPCYFTASHDTRQIYRISHEKTQQSSNGVVAHLETRAEEDSAEDEIQAEEAVEMDGEDEGDESDDVRVFIVLSSTMF